MTKNDLLAKFGQTMMFEVRDRAIKKFEMIAAGSMTSKPALERNEDLSSFSDEQLLVVRNATVSAIDDAIFNVLWMIEEHEENLDVMIGEGDGQPKEDVRSMSDGLSGELFTEDGWIAKFSQYTEVY